MLEYSLIENALHSLSEAAAYYNETDTQKDADRYKFCILLTAHCAELLLKEILRRVHPAFIYTDVDKYHAQDTNEETIGYKLSIKRVKSICGIDFGSYEQYLVELGEVRNRLQHFKFEVNGEYHKQLMCRAFSAIDFLFKDILHGKYDDYTSVISSDEIEKLREDEDRVKARLSDIRKEFSDKKYQKMQLEYDEGKYIKVLCPNCGQDTLAIDGAIKCRMCDAQFENYRKLHDSDNGCVTMDSILRDLGRRRKAGIIKTFDCPECEYDALLRLPNGMWKCFVCGNEYEDAIYCDSCGEEMPNSDQFYFTIQSHSDADDFMFFCPKCAKEARNCDEFIDYEIYRNSAE